MCRLSLQLLAIWISAAFSHCNLLASGPTPEFDSVQVSIGAAVDGVEARYGELLVDRLQEISDVVVGDHRKSAQAPLTVYLGTVDSNPLIQELAAGLKVELPGAYDPGPEGFILVSKQLAGEQVVLAAGSDRRGVLYAVGEFLRRAEGDGDRLRFPIDLDVRRGPRWPVRGLLVVQGHTMRQLTGAREWTLDEWKRAHIDYALAGANTFEVPPGQAWLPIYELMQDFGLRTHAIISGNAGSGPPNWLAKEAIGRTGYLSPAVPEARKALLKAREELFESMPRYDSVHIKSGDGGGDESEAAAPYGRQFIELCRDYAKLLHRRHPTTEVYVGNQKLDNAGDLAIIDHLRNERADWCRGLCYGPGSNAMGWTPGRRQDHRVDLFTYGRRGGLSGYLRYLTRQLPPEQEILLFTDLTHWVYSQYGLMDHAIIADRNHETPPPWDDWMYQRRPSEALAMVYDRRTFHARPRNYYRVFQETTEFAIGDVAYSEGHHDHLNAWIYQRLFWDPHQTVEQVVREYAVAHFGSEAADVMTEAVFLLEQNLQTPIAENDGIDRLVDLVNQAGQLMPAAGRETNYLWHLYRQKAYLDKYIQLDVRQQREYVDALMDKLGSGLSRHAVDETIATIGEVVGPEESTEMVRLRQFAEESSDISDRLYGLRNEGLHNLDQDYVGLGWLAREVARARGAPDSATRRSVVDRIVHYEDPGPGGYYDNAGVPGEAPRQVRGRPYGDGIFDSANRRSQRTMAFTTDQERGVAFRYADLDPEAAYQVRLSLVRPRYLPRFGKFQPQTGQAIYADDHLLVENLVLPEYRADFFEFDIPREATADGELELWMKKQPGVGEGLASDISIWRNTGGWGTLVSEVWLMRSASQGAAAAATTPER